MMARAMVLAAFASLGLTAAAHAVGDIPPPHQVLESLHRTHWGPNLAGEDYPYRGNVWYQLGFRKWPAVMPASKTAPWFMWWPADANQTMMRQDFQSSPYPGWQTPPASGPMTYAPQYPTQYAPQTSPTPVYPVNFYQQSPAPSYWYGR